MAMSLSQYPVSPADRSRWIVERRGPREDVSADRPYAFVVDKERLPSGETGDVATIFLTNRECPWRCTMCDLWRHTLSHPVQVGDIPRQIEFALERLPAVLQVKLYNSGSFFDLSAIPAEDHAPIARLLRPFERVIVESHPSLVGKTCLEFRDRLSGQLEVAMGLETAHPVVLEKLNKHITLSQYAAAADRLSSNSIDLRSFVLVQPPFMRTDEALFWAGHSVDFALDCSSTAVVLIPTRGGNGAMEELAQDGQFEPPDLNLLENAMNDQIGRSSSRILVDLWDIDRVTSCPSCRQLRVARLAEMNLTQTVLPNIPCLHCRDPH